MILNIDPHVHTEYSSDSNIIEIFNSRNIFQEDDKKAYIFARENKN